MYDRKKTARNVAILLLLAAAIAYLPGGGRAAATFQTILGVIFMLGLGFAGLRLYLSRRLDIYGLGDRRRALLYGALETGGITMQFDSGISYELTSVIQSLIVLFVTAPALTAGIFRLRRREGLT